MPAKAGIHCQPWIPAFVGMTKYGFEEQFKPKLKNRTRHASEGWHPFPAVDPGFRRDDGFSA
jgi:hypothetical protein